MAIYGASVSEISRGMADLKAKNLLEGFRECGSLSQACTGNKQIEKTLFTNKHY